MESKLFVAMKAFVVHEGHVLILRESSAYEDAGNVARYDVPGGRIKPGEHFRDSLLREIKEETDLVVKLGWPFFVNEWRPVVRGEQWQIVGTFFEAFADSDAVVLSKDHDQFEWIKPSDFKNYPVIENLKFAFEAYLQHIGV